jgi:hypothetical protein
MPGPPRSARSCVRIGSGGCAADRPAPTAAVRHTGWHRSPAGPAEHSSRHLPAASAKHLDLRRRGRRTQPVRAAHKRSSIEAIVTLARRSRRCAVGPRHPAPIHPAVSHAVRLAADTGDISGRSPAACRRPARHPGRPPGRSVSPGSARAAQPGRRRSCAIRSSLVAEPSSGAAAGGQAAPHG